MKEKTITYLNTKGWYRFLKVMYVLFLTLAYILSVALIIDGGIEKVDLSTTKIDCLVGNRKTFSAKEINLSLYKSDFDDGYEYKRFFTELSNEGRVLQIINSCAKTPFDESRFLDIYRVQGLLEISEDTSLSDEQRTRNMTELSNRISQETSTFKKANMLTFAERIFVIRPAYTSRGAIQSLAISTAIFLTVFEVIRRLFYYVVLGSFFPKKAQDLPTESD